MMVGTDENCCDPNPTEVGSAHPFQGVGSNRIVSSVLLPNIPDPIPKEIADAGELRKFFEQNKYVPYAGSIKESGHSLLHFYQKLYTLSPTHGSVIEKLIKYCFSGAAIFERAKDPEYDLREEMSPLSIAESIRYRDALKNTVSFDGGILKFHQEILRSLKKFGDAWIELSWAENEGVIKFFFRIHKCENVLYLNTKPDEARQVAISPIWNDEYLKQNPPRNIPMFPLSRKEGSVQSTMFHLKNGKNAWYGKPDSQMSDVHKYREAQDSLYLVKEAAKSYNGIVVMEVSGISEDDEKQAKSLGFASFSERVSHTFALSGQAEKLMVMSRAPGEDAMAFHQAKPNTNEKWYKVTGEISSDHILRSHNATRRFMSFEQSNGLSSNPFFDDYITNMAPVIGELRETVTNFTNKILSLVWNMTNQQEMNDFSINFRSPIDKALELYTNSLGNATNQPVGGSTL